MKIVLSRAFTDDWSCLQLHRFHRKFLPYITYTDAYVNEERTEPLQEVLPDGVVQEITNTLQAWTKLEVEKHAFKDAVGAFLRRVWFLASRATGSFIDPPLIRRLASQIRLGDWDNLLTVTRSIRYVMGTWSQRRVNWLHEVWFPIVTMWNVMRPEVRRLIPGNPAFFPNFTFAGDVTIVDSDASDASEEDDNTIVAWNEELEEDDNAVEIIDIAGDEEEAIRDDPPPVNENRQIEDL